MGNQDMNIKVCNWCLRYGSNISIEKVQLKKEMLKTSQPMYLNLCDKCKDKLKDIIMNN